ncbi:tRNA glutamyl-Q(34) synthetase GluQRS [Marinobacter salicampi]|uniref:tRNA glutamyl-Q(34) synthetase GluQRS n=1 Tax=Marinobacter salicampi TaxID=435907 RepID=UPI00140C177A|nr:tRNA glutamyl-Q(34) synthetase GluQRS [Marinobacter salicampi]
MSTANAVLYRGRFAPSPTGPLHFGSLVAALASYLEARSHDGEWLVRMEDLDPLREPAGAAEAILASLDAHGLHSDEPVRYQSRRNAAYSETVRFLLDEGLAYRCTCSRRLLKQNRGYHARGCREGHSLCGNKPFAIRFKMRDQVACWRDQLLGDQQHHIQAEVDDPVIVRKEGFYAYQLAVVVDDIDQRISHVVRGSDLLDLTAQQAQLYAALDTPPPAWLHIPVVLNPEGQKLSKQTHAAALDDNLARANLYQALVALGQRPPPMLKSAETDVILEWAIANYARAGLPRTSLTMTDQRFRD